MGQAKQPWFIVGSRVQHRKSGKKGNIEAFGSEKGESTKEQKYKVCWDDGKSSWVLRKAIRRVNWV